MESNKTRLEQQIKEIEEKRRLFSHFLWFEILEIDLEISNKTPKQAFSRNQRSWEPAGCPPYRDHPPRGLETSSHVAEKRQAKSLTLQKSRRLLARSRLNEMKIDGLVKSRKCILSVIPAKAGIQCSQALKNSWTPFFNGF
jgi:hypothetical protein